MSKARKEFLLAVCAELPHASISDLRLILRHAATLKRIAVLELNEGASDYTDTATERAEKRVRELCASIGLPVKFGEDPRGFAVRVFLPSGRYNSLGGREDGYGVPS